MDILKRIFKVVFLTTLIITLVFLIIKFTIWTCTLPITVWWLNIIGSIFGLESTFAKYIVALLIENIGFIVVVFLVGFFTFSNRKE